jgi:hypothetical protein
MRDRSMRQTHGLGAAEQEFLNGDNLLAIACTLQLREDSTHLDFEGVFVAAVQHTIHLFCRIVSD